MKFSLVSTMAQPFPLPFFNSVSNWDLCVMATQMKDSTKEPLKTLIDPSFVRLNITVSATFCSDNPWKNEFLEGLSMVGTKTLVSSTIDSPIECREKIRKVLVDMGVPLELGECTWRHRFLGSEEVYEMPRVEDVDRLIENICWFLYEVKTQKHNNDFTSWPVNLAITKRIVVPDAEFEGWCDWYERMLDLYHDFETGDAKANGNPRTEDWFLNEPTAAERTIEALKHAWIEN